MKLLRTKIGILALVVALLAVGMGIFQLNGVVRTTFKVKRDVFKTTIVCKGEIRSERTGLINIPLEITDNDLGIWQIDVADLVEEGKQVKKGDYIALLSPSEIQNKINSNQELLNNLQAGLEKKKIDNEIDLGKYKQDIELMSYDIESAKLDVEQSIYESEAYQRQMKNAYDRLTRIYDTKQRNYKRRALFLKGKYASDESKWNDAKDMEVKLEKALAATRITSPSDGMLMYVRNDDGSVVSKGSTIDRWHTQIATLPDMGHLISELYLEEVYIAKVHKGDSVTVTIDALNDRKVVGEIRSIANVGQSLKGSSSKVFRIVIAISQVGEAIKPYMNTSNTLTIERVDSVLVIPTSAMLVDDAGTYVEKHGVAGFEKVYVKAKSSNAHWVWIQEGLNENDVILQDISKN